MCFFVCLGKWTPYINHILQLTPRRGHNVCQLQQTAKMFFISTIIIFDTCCFADHFFLEFSFFNSKCLMIHTQMAKSYTAEWTERDAEWSSHWQLLLLSIVATPLSITYNTWAKDFKKCMSAGMCSDRELRPCKFVTAQIKQYIIIQKTITQ